MTTSRTVPLGSLPERKDTYAPLRALNLKRDSSLLIFDARHACYRAFHTRELSTQDGVPTSCLHGLFELAMAACEAANTTRFVFVWDGTLVYKRTIYSEYKCRHDRNRTREEQASHDLCHRAIQVAREGITKLGFPQIDPVSIEADDAMGLAAHALARKIDAQGPVRGVDSVLLITDDKDHYQLLRPRVKVWRGAMKRLVDDKWFKGEFGFAPPAYVDYKALVGEPATGDNIPGVDGIADGNASKLIGLHGSIGATIAAAKAALKGKKPLKIHANLVAQEERAKLSFRLSHIATKFDHLDAHAKSGVNKDDIKDRIQKGLAYAMSDRVWNYRDVVNFISDYEFTNTVDPQVASRTLGFKLKT